MKRKDEMVYECSDCQQRWFINTMIEDAPELCDECECIVEAVGWRDELGE